MAQGLKEKIKDFSSYTSIHGIGRIADSVFILRKLFWTCVLLVSLGMCIFQVYRLSLQFLSEGVNTKVSTTYKELTFPRVSFCTLNPLSLNEVIKEPSLFQILNETSQAMGIIIQYSKQQTTDTYSVPYDPGADPLQTAKEVFRLRMGVFEDSEIYNMTIPPDSFVMSCKYQGQFCSSQAFTRFRDEDYGTCYTFEPDIPTVTVAGPSTGLELILNVRQEEYLPFITDSSGIRIAVHSRKYEPFMTGNGISVSTAFETNIALTQTSFSRFPGKDGSRCDNKNTYSGILPCMESCIGNHVTRECGCLSSGTYQTADVYKICTTPEEISCWRQIKKRSVDFSANSCKCKLPCSETRYEKDVSATSYPAENQQGVLEVLLNTNSANFGFLRDSLVFVKVYISSLTDELSEEELSYTEENFVSDIGGQLGLWVGMSVLSLAEVLELVVLIIVWCSSKKGDLKTDPNFDEKRNDFTTDTSIE